MRTGEVFRMKQTEYRFNQLENIQTSELTEAKATLEEMAELKEWNPRLNNALKLVGFKESIIYINGPYDKIDRLQQNLGSVDFESIIKEHDDKNIVLYCRENGDRLEVLADRDLVKDRQAKGVMHLYQIPRQHLQGWYESLPRTAEYLEEQRDNLKKIDKTLKSAAGLTGVVGVIAASFDPKNLYIFLPLFLFEIVAIGLQNNKRAKKIEAQEPLIATGSDALRYIADNTTAEQMRLRFESETDVIVLQCEVADRINAQEEERLWRERQSKGDRYKAIQLLAEKE